MTEPNAAAAELLEASAAGYATAAASRLLAQHPSLDSRNGASSLTTWKAHFIQRLLELAAAVRVATPSVFVARVVWQHKAFAARRLDPADVQACLAALRATLNEELPAASAKVVDAYLEKGLAALETEIVLDPSELDPNEASGALALKYIAACLGGNPQAVIELVLNAVDRDTPIERTYIDIVFPALREIGRMWHGAEATVAEERVVSETTRRLMTLLTQAGSSSRDVGKTVISAAVAGNAHDLGVRAVADCFEVAGWRSICLGANVPVPEIAIAVQYFNADLVVLAATLATQIKSPQASIAALRAASGTNVKILVGGPAFAEAPDLWRTLGADGFAGVEDVVERGGELLALNAAD
jgi:methanogenic corrinoid protein MtbC1